MGPILSRYGPSDKAGTIHHRVQGGLRRQSDVGGLDAARPRNHDGELADPGVSDRGADLARQVDAYTGGRRALEELARTSGILPGDVRALIVSYGLPD
jgi:hypothetical protein